MLQSPSRTRSVDLLLLQSPSQTRPAAILYCKTSSTSSIAASFDPPPAAQIRSMRRQTHCSALSLIVFSGFLSWPSLYLFRPSISLSSSLAAPTPTMHLHRSSSLLFSTTNRFEENHDGRSYGAGE